MKIQHINNRLTILWSIVEDRLIYKISYCSLKDQFSRKKGVLVAKEKKFCSFELQHKPTNDNKLIALILLNEVIQNNTPRNFSVCMIAHAYNLGFSNE